jgi:hypothetical protein
VGRADAPGLRPRCLACLRCGGRLRVIATVPDPAVVRAILAHLGLAPGPDSPGPAPPQPDHTAAPGENPRRPVGASQRSPDQRRRRPPAQPSAPLIRPLTTSRSREHHHPGSGSKIARCLALSLGDARILGALCSPPQGAQWLQWFSCAEHGTDPCGNGQGDAAQRWGAEVERRKVRQRAVAERAFTTRGIITDRLVAVSRRRQSKPRWACSPTTMSGFPD